MSDSQEGAYDPIMMPRVSKIRETISIVAQSERMSSVANEDDDPTDVLEAARQWESVESHDYSLLMQVGPGSI